MKRIFLICPFIIQIILLFGSFASEPATNEDLKFEGTLLPAKEALIRSRITGMVVKVLVKEGDTVKKGQVLMELDAEEVERALTLAQIAFERRKLENEKALAELERAKTLKEQKSISDDDYNNLERGLKVTELALKETEVAYEKARKDSESVILKTPIEGTVAILRKSAGDTVAENDEIIRVVDTHELSLVGVLDSSYYGRIKTGMEIIYKTDYLKESFKTRIEKIVTFSENGKEFKISAPVVNTSLKLLPGTTATCIIKLH